jgi:transposase-like protein
MTKKRRRTFDAEFKLQVVQMIRQQGLSVGEVVKVTEASLTYVALDANGRPRPVVVD